MNKNYFPDLFFSDLKTFLSAPSSHESNIITSHDFDPKDPLNRLKMVNIERRVDFCIFLSLLILIDQILYTYDKENYDNFYTKHNIPKLEFCGHGRVNSYPFSIFNYIKIPIDIFTKNTEIFFVEFIDRVLSDRQREIILKALESDKDLDRDVCGRRAAQIIKSA